ncbi:MAG: hypothetical protein KDC44_13115, partial [Phaeodactylibacter sp.]|nr:hypothetical protein [Phaeodactylibacter sp.]
PFVVSYWRERPADQILNENWRSTAKWNESYYKNPAYDQLLDQARTELDFEARRDLYQAAQQLIAEEGGHLIPYHVNQFHVVNNQVSGVPAQAFTEIEWHTDLHSSLTTLFRFMAARDDGVFARMAVILNAALFGLAAFTQFEGGYTAFGSLCTVAAVINLLQLRWSERWGTLGTLLVFLFNALTAAATAIQYQRQDSQYIHYVWWLVVLISIIAGGLYLNRKRKTDQAAKK